MKQRLATYGLAMVLAWSGMAQAQVDLSALDDDMAGPRAQVLVLGSVHLAEMPEQDFKPESLQPLLDRLAAFSPDVITIEAIPGESCDLMARHPTVYDPEGISRFCRSPDEARAATGLDVPAAIAAVNKLADWPTQPTPAQRRHLAALFLAANDRPSALTQWLQLPEAERRAGDGLDDALATRLDKAMTYNSESYQIAARLAARLGLQRVFAVDDHTGDSYDVPDGDIQTFGTAIQQAWDAAAAQMQPITERVEELKDSGDMLALYRYINRPDVLSVKIDSDFGAAMRETSPRHYGQLYVAGWETRNLRMVANIRAAFIEQPGARVLSIVGASHKPWFDSLLGQMQGVDIVDAQKVLQAPAN